MLAVVRKFIASFLVLALFLGTALGDPGAGSGKGGGWINMPGGNGGGSSGNSGPGQYRLIVEVPDFDHGVTFRLHRSMRQAVCFLEFGGGNVVIPSREGSVILPDWSLRVAQHAGFLKIRLRFVSASQEVVDGVIELDAESEEFVVKIR